MDIILWALAWNIFIHNMSMDSIHLVNKFLRFSYLIPTTGVKPAHTIAVAHARPGLTELNKIKLRKNQISLVHWGVNFAMSSFAEIIILQSMQELCTFKTWRNNSLSYLSAKRWDKYNVIYLSRCFNTCHNDIICYVMALQKHHLSSTSKLSRFELFDLKSNWSLTLNVI